MWIGLMVIPPLFRKNQQVPKRTISPESFDAILSELGDDPAISKLNHRQNNPEQDKPTMNRREYEADAMRLPHQFPQAEAHKANTPSPASGAFFSKAAHQVRSHEKKIWLGLALCLTASAAFNSYMIFEWRSDLDHRITSPGQGSQAIGELNEELLHLRSDIEDDHSMLLELIEHLTTQNQSKAKVSSKETTQIPKTNPSEQALKRWRYLGMSESGTSIKGFFDSGSGMQTLLLHGIAIGDWKLTSVSRESASFSSSSGKSISLQVNAEQ